MDLLTDSKWHGLREGTPLVAVSGEMRARPARVDPAGRLVERVAKSVELRAPRAALTPKGIGRLAVRQSVV